MKNFGISCIRNDVALFKVPLTIFCFKIEHLTWSITLVDSFCYLFLFVSAFNSSNESASHDDSSMFESVLTQTTPPFNIK